MREMCKEKARRKEELQGERERGGEMGQRMVTGELSSW